VSKLIEPRTLKGFRDYPPALMIPREKILDAARRVYRSYGYAPIDTPALEYAEVLLGKGGDESDKLTYRFRDHGDRDVAMRFDLTVPFARFAAQNIAELGTPFKRYAMGPVCDLFTALGVARFEVRVNNRLVLNGLLEQLGLADKAVPLLRSLDKLLKIGREKVIEEMTREAAVTAEQADRVLSLAETTGTNDEVMAKLQAFFGPAPNDKAAEGVRRLRELLAVAKTCGVLDGRIKLDLSIARGLDYYTGTIYETFLTDLPGIGSVCSGGRYDNLASLYTKQVLPGVGASLGVDRLLTAMEELKHPLVTGQSTPADVLVLQFAPDRLGDYQRAARLLRAAGIPAEVYPDAKKLGQQFQYAEKRGFKLALIAGPEEFDKGVWKLKDLTKREEVIVPEAQLAARVRSLLSRDAA
jgi:histidyl-tRNA synthetase